MSRLLVATNNPGKRIEIQALLSDLDVELLLPSDLNLHLDVVEDGKTYAGNAARKAAAFARLSGILTLADDSGLEVAALGGQPGIHSARFSPEPGATDADRRTYLIHHLEDLPRPWIAQFRSVVAIGFLPTPGKDVDLRFAEGTCKGEIIPEERGSHGFGYDPIFLIPELGRTMAELSMEEKNQISHRARAVQNARPILIEMLSHTP